MRHFMALHSTKLICRSLLFGNRRSVQCSGRDIPILTKVRHPDVQRGDFVTLEKRHIDHFVNILDSNRVMTDAFDLESYNVDWLQTVRGETGAVLKPKTTEEVSQILAFCYNENLAVCPQGGNSGLVGGSVPVFDEVVVSTVLMNNVEGLDLDSAVIRAQAGTVLESLDYHLADHGLMVPLDLGAKGSCHIGGNVSTNAGGLRLLRYGSLHSNVLGLEVVLAQEGGPVLDLGYSGALKKDNTGYDTKHLFIGSEGTLGFVTKVVIACPPRPKAINVAFLGLRNFSNVLQTFRRTRGHLGEILSSCEFMDGGSLEVVRQNLSLRSPLFKDYPFYILLETSGSNEDHDKEKLSQLMETLISEGFVEDGVSCGSPSKQSIEIWMLRERLPEALLKDGYCYKYDLSLPMESFYDCVLITKERLGSDALRCVGYGHLGDGNLHLNVTTKSFKKSVKDTLEPFVYEWISRHKGSISAEHGIGFNKRNYLHFSKSESAIRIMYQLKKIFDPKGILNPYKVLSGTR